MSRILNRKLVPKWAALIFIVSFISCCDFTSTEYMKDGDESRQILLTPKIYSSMFSRRREEHKLFVKHLLKGGYEKNYKMLELAFEKILELIKENNATLHQSGYNPENGFPSEDQRLQDAVTLILENSCLAGDLVLHLPDISYRILRKYKKWKDIFNWCIDFINKYPYLVDEETIKMLTLFRQEINESQRSMDFVNPYSETKKETNQTIRKKRKKTKPPIKKGPRLVSRTEL